MGERGGLKKEKRGEEGKGNRGEGGGEGLSSRRSNPLSLFSTVFPLEKSDVNIIIKLLK